MLHHLAVLNPGSVDGLLSESAAIRAIADDRLGTPVGDLTVPLPRVRPRNRRSDAARIMYADEVDAVLVVDADTVRGIVTATGLVRSLTGWCGPWQGRPPSPAPRIGDHLVHVQLRGRSQRR